MGHVFFCGGQDPRPCIYYALSLPTELSSGTGQVFIIET